MRRFRLTREAKSDVRAIWAYVARDNPPAADRLLDVLYGKFALLAQQSLLGEARGELGPGIRGFVVGNYLVVYRLLLDGIEVVRVVHSARDIGTLFGETP
jgi:toxin ParE1/3/4